MYGTCWLVLNVFSLVSPAVICTGCTSALLGSQVSGCIGAMVSAEVDDLPEEETGGSGWPEGSWV